jgi:divalent metal cation (Fe/Co/Zn/Cd) transporter
MTFGEYLRESKDPTAKTVIFEDSAALIGIVIAAIGIYLSEHLGAHWDGIASITIGVVLAIVAFALARSSRALLLGEAATPKTVAAIRSAIESHESVDHVLELLTMHMSPKQILVNAHIDLKDSLGIAEAKKTILEIEDLIKKAVPSVDRMFLEIAAKGEELR